MATNDSDQNIVISEMDIALELPMDLHDKPNTFLSLYKKEPNPGEIVRANKSTKDNQTVSDKKKNYYERFQRFLQSRRTNHTPDQNQTYIAFDMTITHTKSVFMDGNIRFYGEDPPFDITMSMKNYDPTISFADDGVKSADDGVKSADNSCPTLTIIKQEKKPITPIKINTLVCSTPNTDSTSGEENFKAYIREFYNKVIEYHKTQENYKTDTNIFKDNYAKTKTGKTDDFKPSHTEYIVLYLKTSNRYYLIGKQSYTDSLSTYITDAKSYLSSTSISHYMDIFSSPKTQAKYNGLFTSIIPKLDLFVDGSGTTTETINVDEFFKNTGLVLPFVFHKGFYETYLKDPNNTAKYRFYEIATLLFKPIYSQTGSTKESLGTFGDILMFKHRKQLPNASIFYKLFSLSTKTIEQRSRVYYSQEIDTQITEIQTDNPLLVGYRELSKVVETVAVDNEEGTDDMSKKSQITFNKDSYSIMNYFSTKQSEAKTIVLNPITKTKSHLAFLSMGFLLQKWYDLIHRKKGQPFTDISQEITEIKHQARIIILSEIKKKNIMYDENMIVCDIEHIIERGDYTGTEYIGLKVPKLVTDTISDQSESNTKPEINTLLIDSNRTDQQPVAPNEEKGQPTNITAMEKIVVEINKGVDEIAAKAETEDKSKTTAKLTPKQSNLPQINEKIHEINERIDNSFYDDFEGGNSRFTTFLERAVAKTNITPPNTTTVDKSNNATQSAIYIENVIKRLTDAKTKIESIRDDTYKLVFNPDNVVDSKYTQKKATPDNITHTKEVLEKIQTHVKEIEKNISDAYEMLTGKTMTNPKNLTLSLLDPTGITITGYKVDQTIQSGLVGKTTDKDKENYFSNKIKEEKKNLSNLNQDLINAENELANLQKDQKKPKSLDAHSVTQIKDIKNNIKRSKNQIKLLETYSKIFDKCDISFSASETPSLNDMITYYLCTRGDTEDKKKIETQVLTSITSQIIGHLLDNYLDTFIKCITLAKIHIMTQTTEKSDLSVRLNECIPSILRIASYEKPAESAAKAPVANKKAAKATTPVSDATSTYIANAIPASHSYIGFLQKVITNRASDISKTVSPWIKKDPKP